MTLSPKLQGYSLDLTLASISYDGFPTPRSHFFQLKENAQRQNVLTVNSSSIQLMIFLHIYDENNESKLWFPLAQECMYIGTSERNSRMLCATWSWIQNIRLRLREQRKRKLRKLMRKSNYRPKILYILLLTSYI